MVRADTPSIPEQPRTRGLEGRHTHSVGCQISQLNDAARLN